MSAAWLEGRRVLAVGRGPGLSGVADALCARGAAVAQGDGAGDAADAAFDAAERTLDGGVDVLVHGCMAITRASAETMGLHEWRAGHSADLDGRFLFAAEFARRRIAAGRGGVILFLMPEAAVLPHRTAILSAHGALENVIKSLAAEWGRAGLRVVGIAAADDDGAAVANLAAYLASDYAAYMTGAIYRIGA